MTQSPTPQLPYAVLKDGSVTTPKGFQTGAINAGLKTHGEDRLDLTILYSTGPSIGAGVFTLNKIAAAPVRVSKDHLARARPRAVVVNSGCANAAVGPQGVIDAEDTTRIVAAKLGLKPEEVLVCSTGVIGVELPMGLLRNAIPKIQLASDKGHDFARAIITTDTGPHEACVQFQVQGKTVTIGGAAKGAGMIHPNMATLLAFVTTDAAVEPAFLQKALKEAADDTFNMLSIDGDTSTNDTLLLFANGQAGNAPISGGPDGALFQQALTAVCRELARMLASTGEGVTKLLEVRIEGAKSREDARKAARTIASSVLLKAAAYGNDPNWGRVLAALGRSGADIVEEKIAVYINEICVMDEGRPVPFFREAAEATMRRPEVVFQVKLNMGEHAATAWGCDLTNEYVYINSAYTT